MTRVNSNIASVQSVTFYLHVLHRDTIPHFWNRNGSARAMLVIRFSKIPQGFVNIEPIVIRTDTCDYIFHQRTSYTTVATLMTAHRNRGTQASKSWEGVYSSAGSLEATACDATRFGSIGDFGLVFLKLTKLLIQNRI